MPSRCTPLALTLLGLCLAACAHAVPRLPSPVGAGEAIDARPVSLPPRHEPHDWGEEPHHISVLLSGTFETEGEEAPSVGLDYEYRVSDFLGLGAVVEYSFEDIDVTTVLAVADLHITRNFILQTGPGVVFLDGEEEFAYRFGLLYEFERGGYTWSPQVHYDLSTGEDAFIFGVALGAAF